jgi:DNA polymerase III psi subunit
MTRVFLLLIALWLCCPAWPAAQAAQPQLPPQLQLPQLQPPQLQPPQLQPLYAADVGHMLAQTPGKPQIVEIWSLDCSYCRENVERIVAWQTKHPDVRLTMVAMDSFDDNAPMLEQVLATMQLPPHTARHANAEAIPDKLRRALDTSWRGELPRTLLIDARGTRQGESGLLSPDVLDRWRRQRADRE